MRPAGLQIAIDGPSGTGKSTASRRLAAHLGGAYLDTGAMYRVATLYVLDRGLDLTDPAAVAAAVRTLPIQVGSDPLDEAVLLAGRDVRTEIRGPEVTAAVSAVSALPEVRTALVQAQRDVAAAHPLIVLEGRDIGTVVLPDAPVKIYLTASAQVRADRRNRQIVAGGGPDDLAAVLADVERRDLADSTREVAPLRPAEDAVVLDTTELSFDEVLTRLIELTETTGKVRR